MRWREFWQWRALQDVVLFAIFATAMALVYLLTPG